MAAATASSALRYDGRIRAVVVADHQPVISPCISVCELNDDEVCLGCGRSLQDIADWSAADDKLRALIVEQARQRLKEFKSTEDKVRSAI